jgi:carbon monoxide dehydrogenase subunit G
MTTFSVQNRSEASVDAARQDVWEVLTDPERLTRLTPYLRRIDADGDRWTWHLVRLPVLGSVVSPSFTELMTFQEPARIDFAHDPDRPDEQAGVAGTYRLEEHQQGTRLGIDLTISVELPFPRLAGPAVHTAMRTVVLTMGNRFAANLVRQLRQSR